jgi:hypothetical protein
VSNNGPDYSLGSNDDAKPANGGPTVTMTVAACITWLDQEIEEVKDRFAQEEHEMVQLILKGTWLHLEVMKAKLTDHAMDLLDQHHAK